MAKRRCGPVLEDFLSGLCKAYSEPDFRKKKFDSKVFIILNEIWFERFVLQIW